MRLICPNCGAQYEVPDDVIPDAGRDVQCSNCGDTWFQHHPDNDPELAEELDRLDDLDPAFEPIPEPEPAPAPDPEPDVPAAPAAAPVRRQLDPSISDVLREEAEHEARARAAEQSPKLETQPDLGLDQPLSESARRAKQARDRMARIRGLDDAAPEAPDTQKTESSASRRDLLPDIDEINSSLRSATDRRPAAADDHAVPGTAPQAVAAPAKRGGFRRGFLLALLLTALLWCLYIFAPEISAQVPAAESILTSYVAVVDQSRIILDAKIQAILMKLDALAAG